MSNDKKIKGLDERLREQANFKLEKRVKACLEIDPLFKQEPVLKIAFDIRMEGSMNVWEAIKKIQNALIEANRDLAFEHEVELFLAKLDKVTADVEGLKAEAEMFRG